MTVLKLLASSLPAPETVGGLVDQTGGANEAGSISEIDPRRHASTSQYPILVSLWMGALMRFPYVSRVEGWLRGFSHWIFGIPTVQMKLLDRMLSTSVDLESLEADLRHDDFGEPYSARAAPYADACAQALGGTFNKQVFRGPSGRDLCVQGLGCGATDLAEGRACRSQCRTGIGTRLLAARGSSSFLSFSLDMTNLVIYPNERPRISIYNTNLTR